MVIAFCYLSLCSCRCTSCTFRQIQTRGGAQPVGPTMFGEQDDVSRVPVTTSGKTFLVFQRPEDPELLAEVWCRPVPDHRSVVSACGPSGVNMPVAMTTPRSLTLFMKDSEEMLLQQLRHTRQKHTERCPTALFTCVYMFNTCVSDSVNEGAVHVKLFTAVHVKQVLTCWTYSS